MLVSFWQGTLNPSVGVYRTFSRYPIVLASDFTLQRSTFASIGISKTAFEDPSNVYSQQDAHRGNDSPRSVIVKEEDDVQNAMLKYPSTVMY